MRISDWSSDVCSSDLSPARRRVRRWLGLWLLLLWVLATLVVLAPGMGKMREHYMFVLMPLPLLLFALLTAEKLHRWRSTAFCGVLAALAVVAQLVLAAPASVAAVHL